MEARHLRTHGQRDCNGALGRRRAVAGGRNSLRQEGNLDRPLSRFPLRGQAGAGGFPPRRRHDVCQQKALAYVDAAGSPHKRDCRPLVDPLPGAPPLRPRPGPDHFSFDTTSRLMEVPRGLKSAPLSGTGNGPGHRTAADRRSECRRTFRCCPAETFDCLH